MARDPFAILSDEHLRIARVLNALEQLVKVADAGDDPAREDVDACVRVFREFVDLGHHEKEETILFPALSAAGVDWESAPLARIREEHRQERYLLRSLRHAARQQTAWSVDDRKRFVSIGRAFLELQRAHIAHEEQVFPMLQARLTPEARDAASDAFARLDQSLRDMDELAELERALCARYPSD